MPIGDQPGFGCTDEAVQVNRAFRAMTRTILRRDMPPDADTSERLGDVLLRLARRRLEMGLLDAREVERLLRLDSTAATTGSRSWS